MIWDKVKQLIESQATKLNIPVEILHESASSFGFSGITVAFSETNPGQVNIDETTLTIGYPITQEFYQSIKTALKQHLPQMAEQYHQSQKDQFKKLVLSGMEKRKFDLKESIEQAEYTIQDLKRQLFDTSRRRLSERQMIKLLSKPKLPIGKRVITEYANLKKLVPGLYQSIQFEENHIKAKTHKVIINYIGEDYEIGILQIDLDLTTGKICLFNLTDTVNGYHHPHVNEGGEICLGNIGNGLEQLLGEFEVYGALELMHKFVYQYNENDAYQKIQYWNDPDYCEDDNEYENCREGGSYGRTCLDCGDTYCPYYECARDECSEDPDFTKCIRCDRRCQEGNDLLEDCHQENPLGCMTCSFHNCSYFHNPEDCRKANTATCQTCNIEHCQYRGVPDETVAA